MEKALILAANQRSALAVTRSLGKRGVPIVTADETSNTLSGSSRYCHETIVYPSPYSNPKAFLQVLKRETAKRNIKIILPMTELTTYLLLKHKTEFSEVRIPFADFSTFETLSDKWKLHMLVKPLKIPTPKTQYISSPEKLAIMRRKIKFPVVLKPSRSNIYCKDKWIDSSVIIASSIQEFDRITTDNEIFSSHPFLIQEYIEGHGQGVFALYDQGKPVTFFAHRRLREKPPSGGVSVLSESVAVDPNLHEISRRILDHVRWHGVAMVEFKVRSDGSPYLMEVNARFWGSLQLAINAGVDFPWLLYQLAIGNPLKVVNGYSVGVKNRWLLGDLDHLYLILKSRPSLSEKIKAVAKFLNFFDPNTRYEVNQRNDLSPFLFEIKNYLWH